MRPSTRERLDRPNAALEEFFADQVIATGSLCVASAPPYPARHRCHDHGRDRRPPQFENQRKLTSLERPVVPTSIAINRLTANVDGSNRGMAQVGLSFGDLAACTLLSITINV